MTRPNFLIIGAHKAGTSSLHRYLQQHPEVYLPELKEPRFFSCDHGEADVEPSPYAWGPRVHPIKTWRDYLGLFDAVSTETAIGEASPCYLNHLRAPARIKHALPEVRLIVSLRDPVDRAYSGYLMAVRDAGETRPFADTIGEQRTAWHDNLAYYKPCQRYLECFPQDRMKFIRAEALNVQPAPVLRDIFSFLEVDSAFEPDTSRQFNKGGVPRSRRLYRLLNNRHIRRLRPHIPGSLRGVLKPLQQANLRKPPALDPEVRARLIQIVREDILRLQDLLGMDLSDWLRVER
jgi:Sulfotransferase family